MINALTYEEMIKKINNNYIAVCRKNSKFRITGFRVFDF